MLHVRSKLLNSQTNIKHVIDNIYNQLEAIQRTDIYHYQ